MIYLLSLSYWIGPQNRQGGKRTGGGGGGASGGGNRANAKPVSAEELDAELDAYVNDMKL